MAGLSKHKNGYYYITWREYDPVKKKRVLRKRSTGVKSKSEAKTQLREFEDGQRSGLHASYEKARRRPIANHLKDYREYQLAMNVTQKQVEQVYSRAKRIFEIAGLNLIGDISESRIRIAISSLKAAPQSKKRKADEMPAVSPRTRNGYLRAVLQFVNWLVRDRRLRENPLIGMKAENVHVDIRHEREPLPDDEFALLYETTLSSDEVIEGFDGRSRAMIYLLAFCSGLRKNEMASLTPASFDLTNGAPSVTVEASYSKRRRRDKVFLPRDLVAQLFFDGVGLDEPIFPNLASRKTNKMIRRDLEAASLAYQTDEGKFRDLHSLRHAYITRVWQAGASPIVARKMARHSDLKTTMGYSHVTPDEEQQIADKLSGIPKPDEDEDQERRSA